MRARPCGPRRPSARPPRRAASAARAGRSGSVARPAASRSAPAQAIIAALSVQSAGGGATKGMPRLAAERLQPRADRLRWPPRRRRRPARSARRPTAAEKTASAARVRSSTTSAAAAWNEAQRSATSLSRERRGGLRLDGAAPSSGPEKEKSQPGRALQRPRQREAVRVARHAPPARHSGRRDREGRAASRSCRKPRRARRRWSCRAGGSGRRLRPRRAACGRRRRAGADRGRRTPSVSVAVSAWPSRWLSGSSGSLRAAAMARAVIEPDQQPADQAGPGGDRDRVEVAPIGAGLAAWRRGSPRPAPRHARARRSPARRRRTPRGPRSGSARCWRGCRRARRRRGAPRPRPSRRSSSRCRAPSRRVRFQASLQLGRPGTRACRAAEPDGSYHPGPEWRKRSASARAAAGWRSGRPAQCATRSPPRTASPPDAFEITPIRTTGDRIQDRALRRGGRQGALHQGDRGGAALRRHRPRRAFGEGHGDVPAGGAGDRRLPGARGCARRADRPRRRAISASLPQGARIGTASLRREALVRRARPDVTIALLRGNVPTRVARVEEGEFDATLLAAAGLRRLGLESHVTAYLPLDTFPPACGQGAVAVECRAEDARMRDLLAAIDHRRHRPRASPASAPSSPLWAGRADAGRRLCAGRRRRAAASTASCCRRMGARPMTCMRSGSASEAAAIGKAAGEEIMRRAPRRLPRCPSASADAAHRHPARAGCVAHGAGARPRSATRRSCRRCSTS